MFLKVLKNVFTVSIICLFSTPQRMDLGECLKVHDLALRADYEIASKEQDFFFELDVCNFSLMG